MTEASGPGNTDASEAPSISDHESSSEIRNHMEAGNSNEDNGSPQQGCGTQGEGASEP